MLGGYAKSWYGECVRGSEESCDCKGAGSLEVGEPADPGVLEEPLCNGAFLVKVDRYGSVSGLVRVRVPLGMLIIKQSELGPSEELLHGS